MNGTHLIKIADIWRYWTDHPDVVRAEIDPNVTPEQLQAAHIKGISNAIKRRTEDYDIQKRRHDAGEIQTKKEMMQDVKQDSLVGALAGTGLGFIGGVALSPLKLLKPFKRVPFITAGTVGGNILGGTVPAISRRMKGRQPIEAPQDIHEPDSTVSQLKNWREQMRDPNSSVYKDYVTEWIRYNR